MSERAGMSERARPARCQVTVVDVTAGERPPVPVELVVVPVGAPGIGAGGPRVAGDVDAAGAAPVASGVTTGGPQLPGGAAALVEAVGGQLPGALPEGWRQRTGFRGDVGQWVLLHRGEGPDVALVGVGELPMGWGEGVVGAGPAVTLTGGLSIASPASERWRRAGAAIARGAGRSAQVAVVLPPEMVPPGAAAQAASALAEGASLARYRYDEYRHSGSTDPDLHLVVLPGGATGSEAAGSAVSGARAGVARGTVLADATAMARDLVNTPPSDLTPRRMAEAVAGLLEGLPGVALEVWDEARVRKERLGGLLGVARGSAEPPCLLRATYTPHDAGPETPHVVLVGKGITFDSGGLSLKTADGMTTMKTDMSGAAAVMAALAACPRLQVPFRVTALAPVTENMPGGGAMKPGDVLTIRNGATIEVLNTDAEGRLVLADALCLAAELQPDAIVDVATLTGAATIALGRSVAALFGTDPGLVQRVYNAGAAVGEPSWPLPLPADYADHIESDVADMKNVGRPGQAGSIAAALLLRRFVGQVPWAHLDIAGTARAQDASGYVTKGGTGFGARTLLELVAAYGPGPAR